jgi:hypothetical protein
MSGVQLVTKLRALGRDDLVVGVTANARSFTSPNRLSLAEVPRC